ncbi:hypothetical protein [Paenibacillus tianjinensis]|uniref:Uncharacterized protein n=1 Tax=Paenibacillus tianjinensis TaxID=2810347 RepID=A0ABX7L5X3_9BACL|nr:hypothetical protein [Paenibacillus tianjinensis]QSF43282.1 hypothetical protein JRJ22_18620 [Paenibacillus tianjinensis]
MIYLNEVMQEYRDLRMESDKSAVIKDFTSNLWKSKCGFKKETKYFTFNVDHGLLEGRPDLIKLFEQYKNIEYKICKSFYKQVDNIDYIKIRINNLYAYYIDKEVYRGKEYYSLLRKPRNEYFKALKLIKDGYGDIIDSQEVEDVIKKSLSRAAEIKKEMTEIKLQMSWAEYKSLIDSSIVKIFKNYKTIDEYEEEHGWEQKVDAIWNEDNYIVKYFVKSIHGYLLTYIRDSKPKEEIKKYCVVCDEELQVTNNRKKYCNLCARDKHNEVKRRVWKENKSKYNKTRH